MKRIAVIGLMMVVMVWMMGASTAHAALGRVEFSLTLEKQFLFALPISQSVDRYSTVKLRVTTKDMLGIFATHYNDVGENAYPTGVVLNWGVMNANNEDDTDNVGALMVVNPRTQQVLREIEPSVFRIIADGLLPEGQGYGTLFSGTQDITKYNSNMKYSSFLIYRLHTDYFDLHMAGISRENVQIRENSLRERLLRASAVFSLLGEGFVGVGNPADANYTLVEGQIKLVDESVNLGVALDDE